MASNHGIASPKGESPRLEVEEYVCGGCNRIFHELSFLKMHVMTCTVPARQQQKGTTFANSFRNNPHSRVVDQEETRNYDTTDKLVVLSQPLTSSTTSVKPTGGARVRTTLADIVGQAGDHKNQAATGQARDQSKTIAGRAGDQKTRVATGQA